jgi:hypothetical protein
LQPKFAEAFNNRGMTHRKLGNYRQASKDFEAAVQAGMETATQHLETLRDEIRQTQERLQAKGLNPKPWPSGWSPGPANDHSFAPLSE